MITLFVDNVFLLRQSGKYFGVQNIGVKITGYAVRC